MGTIHDNITDKRLTLYTCKEHTEKVGTLEGFRNVVIYNSLNAQEFSN